MVAPVAVVAQDPAAPPKAPKATKAAPAKAAAVGAPPKPACFKDPNERTVTTIAPRKLLGLDPKTGS